VDPLTTRHRYQLSRLRTLVEEALFWRDRTASEIRQFSRRQHPTPALQRAAHNRLVCIGGVKLAGLDEVSFDAIIYVPTITPTDNKGGVELSSRASQFVYRLLF